VASGTNLAAPLPVALVTMLGAVVLLEELNPMGGPIAANGLIFAYAANPPDVAAGSLGFENPSETFKILLLSGLSHVLVGYTKIIEISNAVSGVK
jgi:hypothetical protein